MDNVAAGILSRTDGQRLTIRLNTALGQLGRGHRQGAIDQVERFLNEVDELVKSERLPAAAGQPLIDGALAIVRELQR